MSRSSDNAGSGPSVPRVGCPPGPINPLHPALWQRAASRAWRQLAVSVVLLVLFGWGFVWLTSMVKWAAVLHGMPDFVQKVLGDDFRLYFSKSGQVSFLFHHPIVPLYSRREG